MAHTDNGWHLDRKVPIALILTIALQTTTAVWWAAMITFRVANVEESSSTNGYRINDIDDALTLKSVQDAVVVEQIRHMNTAISLLRTDVQETNALLREAFSTINTPTP